MTPQEKAQLNELIEFKRQMQSADTIPLAVDQAFRQRFNIPMVVKKTVNFADTASGDIDNQGIEIPGVTKHDAILVTPPAGGSHINGFFYAFVDQDGLIQVIFGNNSGGNYDPASGDYIITVIKGNSSTT